MNAELTRALAFQRYRNLAVLERTGARSMTHTPGPWTIGKSNRVVTNGNLEYWPVTRKDRAGTPYEEGNANARLIAAAPDMLAALKLADTILDGFPLYARGEAAKTIRAAIAKAEGKR